MFADCGHKSFFVHNAPGFLYYVQLNLYYSKEDDSEDQFKWFRNSRFSTTCKIMTYYTTYKLTVLSNKIFNIHAFMTSHDDWIIL